jgi:hypothetical protein
MRFSVEESRLGLMLLVLATCTVSLGCAPREPDCRVACRVLVDGTPALEVRLVLLRPDQSEFKPVLEGISDSGGDIAMRFVDGAELPSGTEFELTAVIESVGSGDWQVKTPWSDPKKTPLKVKWPPSSGRLDIELPKKAIRPI